MRHFTKPTIAKCLLVLTVLLTIAFADALRAADDDMGAAKGRFISNGTYFLNPNGASQTISTAAGGIDTTGPFFQSLGTNGRSCAFCHQPSEGMSISAAGVALRFTLTGGADPIFRTNDGSNCNHN